MGKIIFALGLILFACLLFWNRPKVEKGQIIVKPDIVNNPVYKELDKEKEPLDVIAYLHKIEKPKTSDVNYRNDRNGKIDDKVIDKNYKCTAELKNGQLTINFGLQGLFGGQGFNIHCEHTKFNIVPYYSTDVIIPGKTVSNYQIIQQKLILNKDKYILGDSIFGYVDFKLIENEKTTFKHEPGKVEIKKITHIGKGYFRGKVN